MKILRICVTLLFVIVLILYAGFLIQQKNADKTYPVITIDSEMLHVSLDASREELLTGVTAYDEKDGDLTDKIIIESISRFSEPGVSIIKYAVCDGDNHAVSASRKITYTNYEPPKFTLSDSLVFGISKSINIRSLLGAQDLIDGDISNKVIITANEYSTNVAGVYYVLAKVTNSKGDMISLQLPVFVEELSLAAPVIELKEYMVYLKRGETFDISANVASAHSAQGRDIRAEVQTDTNLDTNTPGLYEVHYRATDDFGRVGHKVLMVVVEE